VVGLILVFEFSPMVALIRWRVAIKRGERPDTRTAPRCAWISFLQAGLVVLMMLLATAMARGCGL
jgi:putative membrane protein